MDLKCIRCGSKMNIEDRACMKCGAINYYNPENEDFIRKYGDIKEKKATMFGKKAPLDRKKWPYIVALIIIILVIIYILL